MKPSCSRVSKKAYTSPALGRFAAVVVLIGILPLLGCGPVSSRSNAGGPFRGNNAFAGNQSLVSPGFTGGFGQSVFGDQGSGVPGFQPAQGSGARTPAQPAGFQPPRLQVPGFNSQQGPGNQVAGAAQLNQRILALDSDNQLLNTELASLRQRLQLANDYSQTLKTQLADSARQLQQFGGQNQSASQQLVAAQQRIQQLEGQLQSAAQNGGARFANAGFGGTAPARLPSAASLGSNSTLRQRINSINIPGAQPRLDGDVIRIEFPSDQMFASGSYQIQPARLPALQALVATIRQNFPRQIVGVEAHWDGTPLNPATTTHHQLTATQALAVFDRLVSLGVPRSQLFTMALGSNRPRYDQGAATAGNPNRRIELVIYPETYDGR